MQKTDVKQSQADTVRRPVAPAWRRQPVVTAAALVCAASMLIFGVWAFSAPESFSRFIDYAPYNRHLVHDAGAFQIGIGPSRCSRWCARMACGSR
ncbi:MAG: hypothetical protein ACM3ML_38925 [Micromonosporaceae bacterium]